MEISSKKLNFFTFTDKDMKKKKGGVDNSITNYFSYVQIKILNKKKGGADNLITDY